MGDKPQLNGYCAISQHSNCGLPPVFVVELTTSKIETKSFHKKEKCRHTTEKLNCYALKVHRLRLD